MKRVGTCDYCRDPIYNFQEMLVLRGKKYHLGCHVLAFPNEPIKFAYRAETRYVGKEI